MTNSELLASYILKNHIHPDLSAMTEVKKIVLDYVQLSFPKVDSFQSKFEDEEVSLYVGDEMAWSEVNALLSVSPEKYPHLQKPLIASFKTFVGGAGLFFNCSANNFMALNSDLKKYGFSDEFKKIFEKNDLKELYGYMVQNPQYVFLWKLDTGAMRILKRAFANRLTFQDQRISEAKKLLKIETYQDGSSIPEYSLFNEYCGVFNSIKFEDLKKYFDDISNIISGHRQAATAIVTELVDEFLLNEYNFSAEDRLFYSNTGVMTMPNNPTQYEVHADFYKFANALYVIRNFPPPRNKRTIGQIFKNGEYDRIAPFSRSEDAKIFKTDFLISEGNQWRFRI